MIPAFTASSLPRAFKCLASIVHPQKEYRTADNDAGDARHATREAMINAGDYSELPLAVAELLETYSSVRAEVAMAVHVVTGKARELGQGIKRQYEIADGEVPGTADVLAVHLEGDRAVRVLIIDWKGHDEVEHPSINKQTAHNALCAARIFGVDEVMVCISREGRAPMFATLDSFDLEVFRGDLQALRITALAAQSKPQAREVEGDHCRYCNAFGACSKKQTLAVEVINGEMSRRLDVLLPLENDDQARRAREFADKLRQLLKRLDAAVRQRAAERPIPTGGGMYFGRIIEPGNEKIDADIAYAVVREKHGQEVADKAVSREASKAGIERALRAAKIKPVEKAKEEILAEIKARSGITRPHKEKWDEFPAGQLSKPT